MFSEKRKIISSVAFPLFFIIVLWAVKLCEEVMGTRFSDYGIYPKKIEGLLGILTSSLIHKDYAHLGANSAPLLVLSIGLFYFYREVAFKVFFMIYIMTGIWVWFGARPGYHIGASGLIYGLAAFLFFSGIARKHGGLMALSLLVTFLYGGMVWGVFPILKDVSWESHLYGAIAGLILAFFYKKYGPQRVKFDWEDENDDADKDSITNEDSKNYDSVDNDGAQTGNNGNITVSYHYKKTGDSTPSC